MLMLDVRVLKVKRIMFLWVAPLLSLLSIPLLSEKICCDSFCGPKTKSESFSMMSIYFNQVLFSATEIDCHFCLHAQKGSTLSRYVYSENITSIMNNKNYTSVTWVWFLTFVSLVGWVFGSHPCSEGFSPNFLPSQKPTLRISIQLEIVDKIRAS